MEEKNAESVAERAKAAVEDALGLPPGDRTPHGKHGPAREPSVPDDGLTSDNPSHADGTPLNRKPGADE
jgi:hypothetical protein